VKRPPECPETERNAAKLIREGAGEGDLVITMGCGDMYKLNGMLSEKTEEE